MSRKISAYGRRQKRRQTTPANPFTLAGVMGDLQPFTQQELTQLKTPPRVAFESLRRGTGSEGDFCTLACIANNTLICAESIHPECVELAKRAQDALMLILERSTRLGKWGLCSQSLQDLPPILDLHEQLLELYTPLQMKTAMQETMRRMKAGQTLTPESYGAPAAIN